MIKKIAATFIALFVAMVMLPSVAYATGGGNDQPKKIDICHATSSKKNPYTTNSVSTESVTKMGHDGHDRDIIPPFTYKGHDGNGNVIDKTYPGKNWPAGEATLNNGCNAPDERTKVTKPEPNFADKCGTLNDVDLSVAPGTGYTVGPLVKDGNKQTITVSLNNVDDYVWADGSEADLTFSHVFTAENCDLPETGGAATYATSVGIGVLVGAALLGLLLPMVRRRN